MTSTYSTSLRLELMATGDQSGTWGDTTNTNLGTLLEQAITGVLSVAEGDTTLTLTTVNGGSDQARNAVINLTGAMTANRNVVCPTANKVYLVKNSTTGGFTVTFKTSAGTGVAIPPGTARWVYCDGTNVVDGMSGPWTPSTNDGAALGLAAVSWSDLFLASGAVINFNNGNYTLTHSAGLLTANGALALTGSVAVAGTSSGPASLSLAEDTDNGTNKVTIKPVASLASDRTLTLPDADLTLAEAAGATYATQSDQETGASTTAVVTPGRQQFHPSAAKAFALFDPVGGGLGDSYNVSSVTDIGVGNWTVNLATAFTNQYYAGIASGGLKSGTDYLVYNCASVTAGAFQIQSVERATGAAADPTSANVSFIAFGDRP